MSTNQKTSKTTWTTPAEYVKWGNIDTVRDNSGKVLTVADVLKVNPNYEIVTDILGNPIPYESVNLNANNEETPSSNYFKNALGAYLKLYENNSQNSPQYTAYRNANDAVGKIAGYALLGSGLNKYIPAVAKYAVNAPLGFVSSLLGAEGGSNLVNNLISNNTKYSSWGDLIQNLTVDPTRINPILAEASNPGGFVGGILGNKYSKILNNAKAGYYDNPLMPSPLRIQPIEVTTPNAYFKSSGNAKPVFYSATVGNNNKGMPGARGNRINRPMITSSVDVKYSTHPEGKYNLKTLRVLPQLGNSYFPITAIPIPSNPKLVKSIKVETPDTLKGQKIRPIIWENVNPEFVEWYKDQPEGSVQDYNGKKYLIDRNTWYELGLGKLYHKNDSTYGGYVVDGTKKVIIPKNDLERYKLSLDTITHIIPSTTLLPKGKEDYSFPLTIKLEDINN